MGKIEIDYSNVQSLIRRLKNIVSYLEDENKDIRDALRELYDLENYYYDKGEIVRELEYRQKNIWKDIRNTEDIINNLDSFKNEVKEVDEKLGSRFKQNIEEYAKANNIDTTSDFESFLNFIQGGMDLIGFIPVIGDIVDGVNVNER